MSTNKIKNPKAAAQEDKTMGYLRKGELYNQAEIQVLIALAEAHGIKATFNDKDGEVTLERSEAAPEAAQPFYKSASSAQASEAQPTFSIDYSKLADALKLKEVLQKVVTETPVTVKTVFDGSAHLENNKTVMGIVTKEWDEWMKSIGNKTASQLTNAPAPVTLPKGQAITYGNDTVYKVPEEELAVVPDIPSGTTENRATKHSWLHQLWVHVWGDIVSTWWKFFAYTVSLCCIVLAAVSWYRMWQLEDVVKEYYIIKPVLKEDRRYAPLIHTMDSVILKDGIDEVCERVYGEKR